MLGLISPNDETVADHPCTSPASPIRDSETVADSLRLQKPLPPLPNTESAIPLSPPPRTSTRLPPRTKSSPLRIEEPLQKSQDGDDVDFAAGLLKLLSGTMMRAEPKNSAPSSRDLHIVVDQQPLPFRVIPPRKASMKNAQNSLTPVTPNTPPIASSEERKKETTSSWSSGSTLMEDTEQPSEQYLPSVIENDQYLKVNSIYQSFFSKDLEGTEEPSYSPPMSREGSLQAQIGELMDMYDMAATQAFVEEDRKSSADTLIGQDEPGADNNVFRKSSKSSKSSGRSLGGSLGRSSSAKRAPKPPKLLTLKRSGSRKSNKEENAPQNLEELGLTHPDREGNLLFRAETTTPWKRRRCLLKDNHVYIFKSQEDLTLVTMIALSQDLVVLPDDTSSPTSATGTLGRSNKAQFAFKIVAPQPGTGSHAVPFYFAAESRLDMLKWIADMVKAAEYGGVAKTPRTLIPIRGRAKSFSRVPLCSLPGFGPEKSSQQAQPPSPSSSTSSTSRRFTLQSITQKMGLPIKQTVRKLKSFSFDGKQLAQQETDRPPVPTCASPIPSSTTPSPTPTDEVVSVSIVERSNPPTPNPIPPQRTISLMSPLSSNLPEGTLPSPKSQRRSGIVEPLNNGAEEGQTWFWDPEAPPVPKLHLEVWAKG